MNKDDLVQEVFDKYRHEAEKDINLVPEPERTLMVIYNAHGIIGNGGFRYFFENNFEGIEDYNIFIKCYLNLNLPNHAEAIEKILSLFPNNKPHEKLEKRNKFLEKYFDSESRKFAPIVDWAEDIFYKNYNDVFNKAIEYYNENKT